MKKYQVLILITVFLSLFELMYITTMPISLSQRMFMLFIIVIEFIGLGQIWSQKKSHYLQESLIQTWPIENEEKKW